MLLDLFKKKKPVAFPEKALVQPKNEPLAYTYKGIRALFISDTHDRMGSDARFDLMSKEYDVVFCLGDHGRELQDIVDMVPENIPIYGILGNHDLPDAYDQYPRIKVIRNDVFTLTSGEKSIRIAAFEGSVKYKDSPVVMHTQDEYKELIEPLPGADIAIGHPSPYKGGELNGYAHDGIIAITEYLEKYKIPMYLHGHLHENEVYCLDNGTNCTCIYQSLITLL